MKRINLFYSLFICFFYTCHLQAQEDAQWLLGDDILVIDGPRIGATLDFRSDPLVIDSMERAMSTSIFVANTSISDKDGNLLFYTNGCELGNAKHEVMLNGELMSPDFLEKNYCPGSPLYQNEIILPHPLEQELYYFFQLSELDVYKVPPFNIDVTIGAQSITYSIIDMTKDEGLGAVVEKHLSLITDTVSINGFQAVKHANGIDWWIIAPEFQSSCFHYALLSTKGIQTYPKQCLEYSPVLNGIGGQSVVSPNGKYYLRFTPGRGLQIFDFDRCTGAISNARQVSMPTGDAALGGISVSPNSRFVYVSRFKELFQFDLEANDIADSRILIDEWDGYHNPDATTFYRAQLAPDGKIYIATFSDSYNLHVINAPDEKGRACDFRQHAIELPIRSSRSIPSFPHYALGASEEACDTVSNIVTSEHCATKDIELYPNPAIDFLYIKGNAQAGKVFMLYDFLGRFIFSQALAYQSPNRLDLSALAKGVYFYEIQEEGKCIKSGKLVLE